MSKKDLDAYAMGNGLRVFTDLQTIADNTDLDVEELPPGLSAAAMYNDGHTNYIIVMLINGELYRFGSEVLGDDPSDLIPTSLEELSGYPDPRDW